MSIQILNYEFLGPINLAEWGPPMGQVLYILLIKSKDTFKMIYANELETTSDPSFFTKNEKFDCWLVHSGTEQNLYLCIYPMWNSTPEQRQKIVKKIIDKYQPSCNLDVTTSE